jgi:uncharacterized protein YkwD/DNA-directed RNA polymerase subunit RPC12/RpoP
VIRFSCPQCKSVLTGREEHAGKTVACPKCRHRVQVPRVAPAPTKSSSRRTSRGALLGVLAIFVVLVLAAAGGVWLFVRSPHADTEPVAAVREAPPSSLPSFGANPLPPPPPPTEKAKPVEEKPTEKKPPPRKPPEDRPPPIGEPPPLPPPPVEEKKEIELADDVPPELPFDLVDAINAQRAKAGLEPIFLDAALSRACQSQAEGLARQGQLSRDRKGAEAKPLGKPLPYGRGSESADAPLAALEKAMKEPAEHAKLLEPRLRTFGAGFAHNVKGQWFTVFDWTSDIDRDPPMDTTAIQTAIVYPAPGQKRVPLWFPGHETPDPLPDAKNKLAGYPITLTFPPKMRVTEVSAHLSNAKERDIDVWLSSPEKPANPDPGLANAQQNTICLIAKQPLQAKTRYHVEVSASVNGQPWSVKWDFATLTSGEIHHDAAGKVLRTLNGLRRRAGLSPVPLNAERSKACAAHAHYLVLNAPGNPRLNWNAEKRELPGYSTEGAEIAGEVYIQGGGGPVEAVTGLIDSLISRPHLLDPSLRELALGSTPFPLGGWLWVIDLRSVPGRDGDRKEFLYPAADQKNVPLVYPPKEIPSPIPADSKTKSAGYAITAAFGERVRIQEATAKLVDDKGNAVDGWLSTPDKPAIAAFHHLQGRRQRPRLGADVEFHHGCPAGTLRRRSRCADRRATERGAQGGGFTAGASRSGSVTRLSVARPLPGAERRQSRWSGHGRASGGRGAARRDAGRSEGRQERRHRLRP